MIIIRSAVAALVAVASVAIPGNAARESAPAPARRSFSEPNYSPDRREIAFVTGGDIWTVPAAGGDAHLLVSDAANDHRPLYSPDGSQLAFMSSRNGGSNIYVLSLASGSLRRITFGDGVDQLDSWSRDGKWLYFSSTATDISGMADVARVSAAGGTPMPVAGDRYATEYWAAAGPDAGTIAITARGLSQSQWWRKGHSHIEESEIWLVRGIAPGARSAPMTPKYEQMTGPGARSEWPMWSSDGKALYFVSDRSGAPNLWTRPVAGGAERQLTKFTDGRVLWPTIVYDGTAITFERDFGIWSYDVAAGTAKPVSIELRGSASGAVVEHRALSTGLQELALSPDGKKVAFTVRGKIFAASSKDGGNGQRVSADGLVQQQPAWAPDSRRLAFADDREGLFHIYLYDFVAHDERRLTIGTANDITPVWSPDGKSLAYVHGGNELHVLAIDAKAKGDAPIVDRVVARARLDRAPFTNERDIVWSPDSKWIAYATNEGNKLFANAMLVSASGGESRPVSFLSNTNADALGWSPDGSFLLLVSSQRTEPGVLARVDLIPRTPRFREDQFRDLFGPDAPVSLPPQHSRPTPAREPRDRTPAQRDSATPKRDSTVSAATDSTARAADSSHRDAVRHTPVVFEGLRSRLSFLPIGLDVVGEVVAPDGKSVVVTAVAAGQANLYLFPLDELAKEEPVAKQLTSTPGPKSSVQWSPDGKEVYYIESGRISAIDVASRAVRPVSVSAEVDVDFTADRNEIFTLMWRELRDNFFDAKMNGVDWSAVHDEYAPLARGAQTSDELIRLMNEMVGELNASHSGARGPSGGAPYTGRLGVRFDGNEYEHTGKLRVSEIIPLGPADLAAKIAIGDFLVAVDGMPVNAHTNIDELLAYRIGKQTALSIASANDAKSRIVTVLPISTNTEKGLLYRAWVEQSRAYVSKVSGGRLGYVHMPDMSEESLQRLFVDLDAQNQASDGVVIDIRNNNGGFVNAYALDVLTRVPYLTMQIRGLTTAPARTLLGQRSLELPTVLVTNMHSLSDAEDFSEGYRAMKLGKIVGEPTAGWIIYTSNDVLFDGSSVRIPFIRIRGADGSDMEMHPRPVDVAVTRAMGESYSGRDSQLDAAVKTLIAQIGPSRKSAATH